jgi:hypothetical protein
MCGNFELLADSGDIGLTREGELAFLGYRCTYCLKTYRKALRDEVFSWLSLMGIPLLDEVNFSSSQAPMLPNVEAFKEWLDGVKTPLTEL